MALSLCEAVAVCLLVVRHVFALLAKCLVLFFLAGPLCAHAAGAMVVVWSELPPAEVPVLVGC